MNTLVRLSLAAALSFAVAAPAFSQGKVDPKLREACRQKHPVPSGAGKVQEQRQARQLIRQCIQSGGKS